MTYEQALNYVGSLVFAAVLLLGIIVDGEHFSAAMAVLAAMFGWASTYTASTWLANNDRNGMGGGGTWFDAVPIILLLLAVLCGGVSVIAYISGS